MKLRKPRTFVLKERMPRRISNIPQWCPEQLGEMYSAVVAAIKTKSEARRIIEDHMRIRKIPAPWVGP